MTSKKPLGCSALMPTLADLQRLASLYPPPPPLPQPMTITVLNDDGNEVVLGKSQVKK